MQSLLLLTTLIAAANSVQFWCPCIRNPINTNNKDGQCITGDELNQFWCNDTSMAFGASPPTHTALSSGRPGVANNQFLFYCDNAPCFSPTQPDRVHKATVFPGERSGYYIPISWRKQVTRNSGTSLPPGITSGSTDELEFIPNQTHWTSIARKCRSPLANVSYINAYWLMATESILQTNLIMDLRSDDSTASDC